jgi:malonyl-CoA O-methyltransferase
MSPGEHEEFELGRRNVQRSFSRAADGYDATAVLQARVRDELVSRLELVRVEPEVVLDLGTGTGNALPALRARYGASRLVALDVAPGMLARVAEQHASVPGVDLVCADAARLPLRDRSVGLIVSNLMLQWCNDPDLVFNECRRVLRDGGLLSFSTFGPDTLFELRRAWSAADSATHVNRFIDMHDLGDAMLRAGFAEPVMDVDRCTLTYADAPGLMRDLKAIGAHNVNAGRARGLTGRATLARMIDAYEQFRSDGRLPATYEIVYGHAWAANRPEHAGGPAGEVRIPLSRIGRR